MNERRNDWYMTLISLLFGVFLSVWGRSLVEHLSKHPELDFTLARALVVLIVLICLWWWYGVFLGRVAPANNLMMYLWDFVTLTAFAFGARSWHDPDQFIYALVIAVPLMCVRMALVRRLVSPRSSDRKALRTVTVMLAFSMVGVGLVVFAYDSGLKAQTNSVSQSPSDEVNSPADSSDANRRERSRESVKNWTIMAVLGLGILVTFYAAWETEGLSRARGGTSTIEMRPKLKVILADPPEGVLHQDVAVLRECATSGIVTLETLIKDQVSPRISGHLSSVHALEDVDVQATLVCLTSVKDPTVIKAKSFWTYFCHWFDDIFDAQPSLLPRSYVKFFIEHGEWPSHRVMGPLLGSSRFVEFFDQVREIMQDNLPSNKLQTIGIKRILLGSLLFSSAERNYAREKHDEILKDWLSPALHGLLPTYFGLDYIDLTTKVSFELWMGFEKVDSPDLVFLYNLLFAPVIYYHDCDEEVTAGEMERPSRLSREDMAEKIRAVGDLLCEGVPGMGDILTGSGEKLPLRIWQIRSMVYSCATVLPTCVQKAYQALASRLEEMSEKQG